jgi:hypothetical protein
MCIVFCFSEKECEPVKSICSKRNGKIKARWGGFYSAEFRVFLLKLG